MSARKKIDLTEAKSNLDSPHIYTDKALKTFRKDELYEYSSYMVSVFHHYLKKKNSKIDELQKEIAKLDKLKDGLYTKNKDLTESREVMVNHIQIIEGELNSKVKCEDMPKEVNSLVNYFDHKVNKIKWYHLLFNPMIVVKEYNFLRELLIKLIVLKETVNEEVGKGECN